MNDDNTPKVFDGHLLGEETSLHRYVVEASAIGLKPGEWPTFIAPQPTVGNARSFMRDKPIYDWGGQLVKVIYRQVNGCVFIDVCND